MYKFFGCGGFIICRHMYLDIVSLTIFMCRVVLQTDTV